MKNVLVWILVLVVVSLAVVACQPSQAGDEAQTAVPEPATAEPAITPLQDSAESVAGATPAATLDGDVYSEATAPGGGAESVSDVLGEGQPVIVYGRSGGIAGIMETYEIYQDGRMVFTEKGGVTELMVPVGEVKVLLALLDQLDLAASAETAPSSLGGQGADRFAYNLTIVQDGTPVQVTWVEGQSGVPAGLLEVVVAIQELIQSAQ